MTDFPVEDPPTRLSPWAECLAAIARQHPTGATVRVGTYDKSGTPYFLASVLRTNKRGTPRPHGTWTFKATKITTGPDAGRFGLWATFDPPKET